jgi:hypothetical protein
MYALAAAALFIAGVFLRVLFVAVRRSEDSLMLVLAFPLRRPPTVTPGYVVAVPSREGEISLVECLGEPPRVGELIQDAQLAPGQFLVVLVDRSPLPRDARPCAFLRAV